MGPIESSWIRRAVYEFMIAAPALARLDDDLGRGLGGESDFRNDTRPADQHAIDACIQAQYRLRGKL